MNKNFDEKKNIITDEELEKVSAGMEGSVLIPIPYINFEAKKLEISKSMPEKKDDERYVM